MTMSKHRWTRWVIEESADPRVPLPWQRNRPSAAIAARLPG